MTRRILSLALTFVMVFALFDGIGTANAENEDERTALSLDAEVLLSAPDLEEPDARPNALPLEEPSAGPQEDIPAGGASGDCGENVTWTLTDDGVLTISGTGEMKDDNPPWCDYRGSIITVKIKNGVTSIGDGAFCGCTSLESVTIPSSVTSIGYWAFSGCWSLESVTIPEGVKYIYQYAFRYCTSLASVTIPASCEVIYPGVFESCSSLTAIHVASGNQSCCDVDGVLFSYTKRTLHTYPAGKKDENYTIPSYVDYIYQSAFVGCSYLKNIIIPDSVTSIDWFAFEDCTNLESVTIPSSMTSIGKEAFAYCRSLASSITIPSSVTSIGDGAFFDCTSLESVIIQEGVTSIGEETFGHCTNLKSITIPSSVTSIGDYVFEWCESLASVTIPSSVTSIGDKAFYYCTSLTDVYYTGTEAQWNTIKIEERGNKPLLNAKKHWNSTGPDPDESTVTFTLIPGFDESGGVCYDVDIPYSDSYFFIDSTTYSVPLARASLGLAYAAYSYQCAESGHTDRGVSWSVVNALAQLGFEVDEKNIKDYEYFEEKADGSGYLRGTEDTIGSAFGIKYLDDGTPLIAIAVRGGGYDNEWDGDFEATPTVEWGGFVFHKNFFQSAAKVLERLNWYLAELEDRDPDIRSTAKFWLTGYSRGAAVADVAAHILTKNRQIDYKDERDGVARIEVPAFNIPASRVYAYTFATPAAARAKEKTSVSPMTVDPYIHNTVGYADPITMVMPRGWRYTPFGDTRYLPNQVQSKTQYDRYCLEMETQYSDLMSKSDRTGNWDAKYKAQINRRFVVAESLNYLTQLIKSDQDFNKKGLQDWLSGKKLMHSDAVGEENEKTEFPLGKLIWVILWQIIRTGSWKEPVLWDVLISGFTEEAVVNWLEGKDGLKKTFKDALDTSAFDSLNLESMLKQYGNLDNVIVEILRRFFSDNGISTNPVFVKNKILQTLNLGNLSGLVHLENGEIAVDLIQEHYPEVYLSWMLAVDKDTVFVKAYRGQKITSVRCPTDVYVYDGDGILIGSIVDGVVDSEEIYMEVTEDNEKTIYTPLESDIRIEVVATGEGTMEISVAEYPDSYTLAHRVIYTDLPLVTDQQYEVSVDGGENGEVSVETQGQTVSPTVTMEGTIGEETVCVVFDWTDGSGDQACAYTNSGVVEAFPEPFGREGVFLGWFTEPDGGEQVTEDTVFLEDTTLYAHWDAARPGDADGNGAVNTTDVILIRRYIAGGYNVTIDENAADVDGNGVINTTDVILMRRFIAGGYGVVLKPGKIA